MRFFAFKIESRKMTDVKLILESLILKLVNVLMWKYSFSMSKDEISHLLVYSVIKFRILNKVFRQPLRKIIENSTTFRKYMRKLYNDDNSFWYIPKYLLHADILCVLTRLLTTLVAFFFLFIPRQKYIIFLSTAENMNQRWTIRSKVSTCWPAFVNSRTWHDKQKINTTR